MLVNRFQSQRPFLSVGL